MSTHTVFPSAWAQKKLQQSDNENWVEEKCGGFPYYYRYVKENDAKSHNKPTLECEVTFHMTALEQGDVVCIEPTDFTMKLGAAMRGVQDLLLQMVEGDKIEAIFPETLTFPGSGKGDVYVEIELKKLTYYTGIQFVKAFGKDE